MTLSPASTCSSNPQDGGLVPKLVHNEKRTSVARDGSHSGMSCETQPASAPVEVVDVLRRAVLQHDREIAGNPGPERHVRVGVEAWQVRHDIQLVDEAHLAADDCAERLRELEVAGLRRACVTGCGTRERRDRRCRAHSDMALLARSHSNRQQT